MDIAKPVAVIAGKQTVKGSKGRKRGKLYILICIQLMLTESVFVVNNLFSVELERRYNVLAWFHITDIWTEYQPIQSNGTRYKHYVIRLEKINLDSPSWWSLPGNAASEDHAVDEFHCSEVTCRSCYTPSQEIFKEGWCCLEKSCVDFFRFSNATVDIDSLQYNENFLNKRKGWTGAHPLPPLAPALPTIKGTHFGSEAQYKGGIVCPTCKIACRRMHWNGWTCEKECGFAWHMPPQPVSIEHVQGEVQSHMGGRGKYYEVDPLIERVAHNVQGYEATTFYLPNTPNNSHEAEFVGSVTIFRPLKATLERPEGLNDLLGEIQRDTRNGDIALRRHPARCKGEFVG
jgi:hypothetical protein